MRDFVLARRYGRAQGRRQTGNDGVGKQLITRGWCLCSKQWLGRNQIVARSYKESIEVDMNYMARITSQMMFCISLLVFASCCAQRNSSKSSELVADPTFSAQEKDIAASIEELEILEKAEQKLTETAKPIPKYVQSEATKAKNAICSDRAYFSALQAFHGTITNRARAVQAELGVYGNWHFADTSELISTNQNTK